VHPVGSRGKPPEPDDTFFVKICYSEPVLRCIHDYTNEFYTKWKKNHFEGRKVVRQATMLAQWAQKVGTGSA